MIGSWVIGLCSFLLFLLFQTTGIFGGDSGDVVTAAVIRGVPHPPGYPLYTLLGWLVSHIPILTPSWRVTLLSSIPHAVTVALLYDFLLRLTRKNILAGIFGALLLAGNYLFFLYSITPEVFALFDLFVIGSMYLLFRWHETKKIGFLTAAVAVFGLALTHHHLILFFIPAGAYFLYSQRKMLEKKLSFRWFGVTGILFLLAVGIPTLYIPVAASSDPIINWDRAVTWEGFIRLITRADYGTFVSGGSIGHTLKERWIAVIAYLNFLRIDWTVMGMVLSIIGLVSWYKSHKSWAVTWLIAFFCIGPIFFFYASFPLASRFTLGTYERFLLPGYLLLALAAGTGFNWLVSHARIVLSKRFSPPVVRGIMVVFIGILLCYPLSFMGMSLWRFWGLSSDKTADHLGMDILAQAAPGAVLLLSQDTALFTTQYVRYGLGVRSDTAVIHAARLPASDYQIVLKKHFPTLVFPDADPVNFTAEFIKENSIGDRRVYSNTNLPIGDGWYWVPRGLLYEAVPYEKLPDADAMYKESQKLRATMHDARKGILSRYPHLMLSDVLDVYATGHIALGKTLIRAEMWEEARNEFSAAVALEGDTSLTEALEMVGLTHLYFKECDKALAAFSEAKKRSFVVSPVHLKMESVAYGECLGDEKKAREIFSEYERQKRETEQPLDTL